MSCGIKLNHLRFFRKSKLFRIKTCPIEILFKLIQTDSDLMHLMKKSFWSFFRIMKSINW